MRKIISIGSVLLLSACCSCDSAKQETTQVVPEPINNHSEGQDSPSRVPGITEKRCQELRQETQNNVMREMSGEKPIRTETEEEITAAAAEYDRTSRGKISPRRWSKSRIALGRFHKYLIHQCTHTGYQDYTSSAIKPLLLLSKERIQTNPREGNYAG